MINNTVLLLQMQIYQLVQKRVNTLQVQEVCVYSYIYLGSKPIINPHKSKSKARNDSNTKSMSKGSRNEAVKNLKANTIEKSSDVPTVEFDFSGSTSSIAPVQIYPNPLIGRRSSLQKYMNPSSPRSIITNFAPQQKSPEYISENTIEINESKLEAVKLMHKIIKNHILMNYMIRWIENGFMHFPEGQVSPIPEKDEILEYSAIEREGDHYLQPITEESLADIDKDAFSDEKSYTAKRLDRLKRAIEICQNIDNKPEILMLKAFKEWKRLGIKISLEKLLQYRETLDKLQAMPMSEEDYYYEGEESDLSL